MRVMLRWIAVAIFIAFAVAERSATDIGASADRHDAAGVNNDSQDDVKGADAWPVLAWIHVELNQDKMRKNAVHAADCARVAMDAASRSLEDISNLTVMSNGGTPVRLRDVGTVDIAVVRRNGPLAKRVEQAIGLCENVLMARIIVEPEEQKMIEAGVDEVDLRNAVERLSPETQYTLKGIRQLTVPRRNGRAVTVAEVAKVIITWKRERVPIGTGFSGSTQDTKRPTGNSQVGPRGFR